MRNVFSVFLICMLMLALIGCGGGKSTQDVQSPAPADTEASVEAEAPSEIETQIETEATAETETPDTEVFPSVESMQAEETSGDTSLFVGNWLYYAQEGINGGQTVTHEDVEKYREQGYGAMVDMVLSIYEDGTCKLLWFDEISEGSWTAKGDGTGSMQMEGKTMTLSIKDGMLQFQTDDNISFFEKTDRIAA